MLIMFRLYVGSKMLDNLNNLMKNNEVGYAPRRLHDYSLLECFVVLWWPVVILGLGAEFALLVGQLWADGVDLHKRPEHGVGLPDEVVHFQHWEQYTGNKHGGHSLGWSRRQWWLNIYIPGLILYQGSNTCWWMDFQDFKPNFPWPNLLWKLGVYMSIKP